MANPSVPLGAKVRGLRRERGITQVELAERLGISGSYLNLIEHDRRPLSAPLLLKLADILDLDLNTFTSADEERLIGRLREVFGDPLVDQHSVKTTQLAEIAAAHPNAAKAVVDLYRALKNSRDEVATLAQRLPEGDLAGIDRARLPSEEVSDLIQRHMNYFPDLEAGATRISELAGLQRGDMQGGMLRYMEQEYGVQMSVESVNAMGGAVKRFDPDTRRLYISEILTPRSRKFQVAHQLGLLSQSEVIEELAEDPSLTTADSRALARVALANYFASSVLMPYDHFLEAAQRERYDIQLLRHRFRASYEQICHRLTTLRKPGAEGIPFHLVRIDIAGNISKRFSASGIRFARFSGACPRWNVFRAFLTPGIVSVQLSRMPDGAAYFSIARTLRRSGGGYRSASYIHAVEIGCPVEHARDLVYADGVDLENEHAGVEVGVTCRLCERLDCEERAFPPLQYDLEVDENLRGVSFFAPLAARTGNGKKP